MTPRPGHRPADRQSVLGRNRQGETILWNGPMGLFEDKRFAEGTNAVASRGGGRDSEHGAKSIIGGGDSVKASTRPSSATK